MLADFIHLALASAFIIFYIYVGFLIYDCFKDKNSYTKNIMETLQQVNDELEWYGHLETYGQTVNQSKRRALLSERETLLGLINEENR